MFLGAGLFLTNLVPSALLAQSLLPEATMRVNQRRHFRALLATDAGYIMHVHALHFVFKTLS